MAERNCGEAGQKLWLEFEEMGVRGWAKVLSVQPHAGPRSGIGQVVTGTFTHRNPDLQELRLGDGRVLEATGRHPLWSRTRGTWVRAAELWEGEQLATREGSVRVLTVRALPGVHRLYNLEVLGAHCYYAGDSAVLAHNDCASGTNTSSGGSGNSGQPRAPNGTWTSGDGSPPGARSEQEVWDAVEEKKGWSVTRGRVHTTDSTGQVRVYDGVAHSPRGKNIALEVKSGTARKTASQRAYDARVNNGQSTAKGTGQNKRVVIDRVKEIRRPAE